MIKTPMKLERIGTTVYTTVDGQLVPVFSTHGEPSSRRLSHEDKTDQLDMLVLRWNVSDEMSDPTLREHLEKRMQLPQEAEIERWEFVYVWVLPSGSERPAVGKMFREDYVNVDGVNWPIEKVEFLGRVLPPR